MRNPGRKSDCPGEEALAEFAGGALTGPARAAVEAHLDGCADCSWLVGRLIGEDRSSDGTPTVPEVRARQPAHYLLREVVGSGGMGTVYEAEDVLLGRRVALKLLREDAPARSGRAERFLREARITAMLEHPNIAPVLEVGVLEDGAAYYTQRLVRGRTLAKAISGCADLNARLALLPHFRDLCNAIAYAHGRGVVHRDIKPSNVLVGAFGETVVVDWGLARLRDAPPDVPEPGAQSPVPGITLEGQAVGTPGYMSPEQASGRLDEVDERSDVFSLGAVLFELLMGRPPFPGKSDEEILRRVVSGPPPEVESGGLPPDLAAVAVKALARDPALRYASAAEMELDVKRWSNGRRVAAYRYTRLQIMQRLAARYRASVAALLVSLILGGGWLGNVWGRAQEQHRQRADDLIARGVGYSRGFQWDRSATYFAGARLEEDRPGARWGLAAIGQTGLQPLYKLRRHAGPVRAVAFSPDGQLLASGGGDRTLRLFEAKTGLERATFEVAEAPTALAFTPDGRTLAAAVGPSVELWTLALGARAARLELGQPVRALAISADGRSLGAASATEARIWDLATLKELARAAAEAPIDTVGFLPSGELAFGGAALSGMRRFSATSPPTAIGGTLHIRRLAACDSSRLAVVDTQGNGMIWRMGAPGDVDATLFQGGNCSEMAATPGCGTVACVGSVANLRLWDLDTGREFAALAGAFRQVLALAFSPDGSLIAVASADHAVRIFALGAARAHVGSRGPGSQASGLAWSPDGKLLVSSDLGGPLELWDPGSGRSQGQHASHPGARAVAFAPDGAAWASAGDDGVQLWNPDRSPGRKLLGDATNSLALSASQLAAGGADGVLRLAPLAGGAVAALAAHRGEVRALAFTPDGSRLASAGPDAVLLWDPRAPRLLARLEGHDDEVHALAFSPDGLLLASAGRDRAVHLWDSRDGRSRDLLLSERIGEVEALAFAPLGSGPAAGMLLIASSLAFLELWDTTERKPVLVVGSGVPTAVRGIAFSPDARRAALLSADGVLHLQDLAGTERLGPPARDLADLMKLYKYQASGGDLIRDEEAMRPPADR